MRCDECGCDVAPEEVVQDTKSEQTSSPSRYRGNTSTVLINLCPTCAKKRSSLVGLALKFLGPFLIGIGLIAGVSWLLK